MVLRRLKENDLSINIRRQFFQVVIKSFYSSLLLISFFSVSGQNVLMQHNDLKRTGWDAGETTLTQSNVSGGTFGKIFQVTVDDQTYSQPLVVNNVNINVSGGTHNGTHNVVIVTTVNNSVYAFDADDGTLCWHVNLTYPTYRPIQNSDMSISNTSGACGGLGQYDDFAGKMGIVGTPAIDVSGNGTIYVVARSVGGVVAGNPGQGGTFVQYLHALNLIDGTEKSNSPVAIDNSITITSNGITTHFDPWLNNQRPALLLYNGVVYISWSSHCDWGDYHGWIIGYDASLLTQKYAYNVTAEGTQGGIWMSGQGPSVDDAGNIYVATANGTAGQVDGSDPNYAANRGESVIKLTPDLKTLVDFFTPNDFQYLNDQDLDYGSAGVLLIPHTDLSLSGSKEGFLYLVNTNNMGHWQLTYPPPPALPQLLDVNVDYGEKEIHGSPVYFMDDQMKEYIYGWASDGFLKQFPLLRQVPADNSLFDLNNITWGNTKLPAGGPGAMLSVSSNGSLSGTGILWASHPFQGDGKVNTQGILQAFDATDVSHELWNSNLNALRDSIGTFAKFVPPTIANGKVYMAQFSNNLKVYGLNAPIVNPCTPPATPVQNPWTSGDIGYMQFPGDACFNNGTFTVTSSGTNPIGGDDGMYSVFQPVAGNQMEIVAHISSMSITTPIAKAGIMFRANLDPGSPNVFLASYSFDQGTIAWNSRQTQNAMVIDNQNKITSDHWLKLSGLGNVYTAYSSPDGSTGSWTTAGSVTVSLGTHIYAGLAYTTANNALGTAVFDNVSVTFSGTLPVTLIDFTAYNKNNQYSQLNWVTSAETDFNYFNIEHSTSNTDFISIGTIEGNGNLQVDQNYNFIDNNPADGANFYRLKMVDKDGKVAYSKVVKVTFNLSIMSLYPNPAKDKVFLKTNLYFTGGEQIRVELINPIGQHLLSESFNTNGLDQITVNFPSGIKSGVYYLKTTNSKGQKQNWKILVKN
jgi:Secretion system C-terminal sorting domain/PQQ enzyme repeat